MMMNLQKELRQAIPSLHLVAQNDAKTIRGRLPVIAADGTELDSYEVEIELAPNHPNSPPIVREVGGRIPRTLDRHNPNGIACLFVPDQQWEFWNEKTSLIDFLKTGAVQQFFFSQTYFEETGVWPFGERAHGLSGIKQYYFELLGTDSLRIVICFLNLLAVDRFNHLLPCYCGKISKICNNHIGLVRQMRTKISQDWAICIAQALARTMPLKKTRLLRVARTVSLLNDHFSLTSLARFRFK